jgi:Carboxypeptidase regulatory-like domain
MRGYARLCWVATMKLTFLVMIGMVGLSATTPARAAQIPATAPAYVNENQTDPAPLKLSGVDGAVRGLGGDAIPRASVSLFTEEAHTLVGTIVTDKDGKFRFNKIGKGLYRVVARVEGLCTANIPIKVESSFMAHRRLEITMRAKDIDTCSYGMAKK